MSRNTRINATIMLMIIILVLICSGCGTIAARVFPGVPAGVYPATRADYYLTVEQYQFIKRGKFDYLFMAPFIVIDYPISIILDTILLPADLYIIYGDT